MAVLNLAFALPLAALLTLAPDPSPRGQDQGAPGSTADDHSVVICGHLYSLYTRSKIETREPIVHSENVIERFAAQLEGIGADAVFFLGDNTRYSTEEEWEMLDRVFAPVEAEKVWVPGNHDYRDIDVFKRHGGKINESLVIHRNKYILLDAKSVYEEVDLKFLERELRDHESYDNVFILMHMFLINYKDPEPGIDPYESYSGMSNWNRDVVPMIAGKVKYVFSGDFYPMHAMRLVQEYGEHEVHYIRNAFLFRRGRGDDQTGDGPMLFLELRFRGGEFEILPRAVPLDLKDPWFRDFKVHGSG